eukprot:362057_1
MTQSTVSLKNVNNNNYNNILVLIWFIIFIQLLVFIFVFQPRYIILTMNRNDVGDELNVEKLDINKLNNINIVNYINEIENIVGECKCDLAYDVFKEIPFKVIHCLIYDINYGGRVIDNTDRRMSKRI